MAHLTFKLKVWEEIEIPDNLIEKVKQGLESGKFHDRFEVLKFLKENNETPMFEFITDSIEVLEVSDNNGKATIELAENITDDNPIYSNLS